MSAAPVALRCRTSDRTPGRRPRGGRAGAARGQAPGPRGAADRRAGRPAPHAGTRTTCATSRGCLLEAGGQVDDALAAGNVPVLLAAECSIALTTLPAVAAHSAPTRRCSGSTPTATSTRPRPPPAATSAAWRWRGRAGAGTPASATAACRRSASCSQACATSTSAEREALERERRDRDRREPGRDARGGQERARRRAGLRAPRPRRARSRGVPRPVPRARRPAPRRSLRPARGGGRRLRGRGHRDHRLRGARGRAGAPGGRVDGRARNRAAARRDSEGGDMSTTEDPRPATPQRTRSLRAPAALAGRRSPRAPRARAARRRRRRRSSASTPRTSSPRASAWRC